jgi:hypothetical protein
MKPAATAEHVARYLQDLGVRAEVIVSEHEGRTFRGVSIWDNETDRYPITTAWEPDDKEPNWVWGSKFQFGCHGDVGEEGVATRILETMPR